MLLNPNRDTPLFFKNIKREIGNLPNTECIIFGDWNLVLGPDLDCLNYKHVNNPRARRQVFSLKIDINLVDVWRENNPEDRKFTWRKKLGPGRTQMSHLDFFLVSDTLLEVIKVETILPGYRSDHSIITIKLGKDYSGTKFFYIEPLFLNKAHSTK